MALALKKPCFIHRYRSVSIYLISCSHCKPYLRYQQQLQQNRQAAQRMQPQTQIVRYGSAPVPRPPGAAMSPPAGGQMPNGTGPSHGGQPALGFPMSAQLPNPQLNGLPSSSVQPTGPNAAPGPTNTAPSPAPNQVHGQQSQPQQRPMSNIASTGQRPPFQSTPSVNSPAGPNTQQGTTPGAYPVPMGHLGMTMGPSSNLAQMNINRSGMLPPHMNGGGAGSGGGGGAPQTPTQTFTSTSRSATPAQGQGPGMTQPSPTMAARQAQVQTPTHPNFNVNLGNIPPSSRGNFDLNAEINKIDNNLLTQLKSEMGLENKDVMNMTPEEKVSEFPRLLAGR